MLERANHVTPVRSYVLVLLALLILTGVTAGVSLLRLPHGAIAVALSIATVKVGLVGAVFMHLRADSPALRAVIALALALVLALFGLSALDWKPRDGDFERLPVQSSLALRARGLE